MPRPAYRGRSLRRVLVKAPGGRASIHYERRKPGPARCGICGRMLGGIPRARPSKMKRVAKVPSRPYGGCVCHECLKEGLKEGIRKEVHYDQLRDY